MNTSALGQNVWSAFHILRGNAISYDDYLEQTHLSAFLKLANEYAQ